MNIKKIQKEIKNIYNSNRIPLHEPLISKEDKVFINKCIDSTFVSTVGNFVDKFEEEIKKLTKSKYVIAVNSGTSALHAALLSLNTKNNNEVLLPSATYVATGNAVLYCNAIPHFVDISFKNLGIDFEKLRSYLNKNTIVRNNVCINRKTKRIIKSLIVVHAYGHSADMDLALKLCRDFKLDLIEDSAECVGSYYKNKHLGTFGKAGILSFNGNKTITTGAGGAIITNSYTIYKKAKKLTITAKIPHQWEQKFEMLGFNYKMNNLNAALGCSQIKKLKNILKKKRKLNKFYRIIFKNDKRIKLLVDQKNTKTNYWLNCILLNNNLNNVEYIKKFHKYNILCKNMWKPLHKLKYFKKFPKMDLKNTIEIYNRLIVLPSSANILENKIDKVINEFK